MLDEAEADRQVTEKYRRMAQPTSTDHETQVRIAQLQYPVSKLVDIERAATVMIRHFSASPDVVALATTIKTAAIAGTQALGIAMHAMVRGPELGQAVVARAAMKALSKDIPDFSALTGVSVTLMEELDKSAVVKGSEIGARPVRACYTCGSTTHLAFACTSPHAQDKSSSSRTSKPSTRTTDARPPEPHRDPT